MTEERTTPLRPWMVEDMRIRGMGEKAQKSHSRHQGFRPVTEPLPRNRRAGGVTCVPVAHDRCRGHAIDLQYPHCGAAHCRDLRGPISRLQDESGQRSSQ